MKISYRRLHSNNVQSIISYMNDIPTCYKTKGHVYVQRKKKLKSKNSSSLAPLYEILYRMMKSTKNTIFQKYTFHILYASDALIC